LGRDGFWAAKREGVWSAKFPSPIEAPWSSERVLVTDSFLANALSTEARAAMKLSSLETPSNSTALILAASNFAAHKHRDQRRKGGDALPYINHPIAVANLLANEAGITDPVVLAAAVLHDTIEDTDTTAEELEGAFGSDIAGVVVEVTDDKSLPKHERKRLQIEHAGHISHRAQLVKLADKICNLRDMTRSPPVDWSLERRREYFAWAKRVVEPMSGQNATLDRLVAVELARSP
jgi:guanosine-3',5'-bis(diphosphate) 3'-pyrophosphohydrolase